MKPEAVGNLVQMVSNLIGDPPIGIPFITTREDGPATVTFRGRNGLYDIADTPKARCVIHYDEETKHPGDPRHIKGIYNLDPSEADLSAAKFIPQVVSGLAPLTFQIGYVSSDSSATNWKRYLSGGKDALHKSRRFFSAGKISYTQIEIVLEGLIVACGTTRMDISMKFGKYLLVDCDTRVPDTLPPDPVAATSLKDSRVKGLNDRIPHTGMG